jgi:hypothetical protein
LNATTGGITFTNIGNTFSNLTVNAGGAVSVANSGSVNLGSVNGPSTFTLSNGGNVSQTGPISIGNATITSMFGSITLNNAANAFSGTVTPTTTGANSVSIRDGGDLTIGSGADVGGAATFVSGGSITQSGPLTVGGTTTLQVSGPTSDINLSDSGNDLTGAVNVGNTAVHDLALTNTHAGTGFAIPAMSISNLVNIDVNGSITQTGALTSAPQAFYTARGGNPITLENAANQLAGNQRFMVVGGAGNVSVVADGDLGLAAGITPGNLKAVAGGRITIPTGSPVTVGGSATLVTDADAVAPAIGTGGVTIPSSALTSGGPLAIYTAKRSQNTIGAPTTLNGSAFTPGTEFVDTAREVWNTRFPAGTASNPYTIFYEEAAPPPEQPPAEQPPAEQPPAEEPPAEQPPAVPVAPNTTIDSAPKAKVRTSKRRVKVSFEFSSDVAGATFRCALDGKHQACTSPFTARVKKSRHHFEVVASANGLTDATPAEVNFKVLRRHHR